MKVDYYVKKYLKGDALSFNSIYELTKKDVYLSIYIYIKDKMIIEDLMQDTYLKVIDKISYYKIGTNFHAWISKIARNIAINYYNKSSRESLFETNDQVFDKNHSKEEVHLDMLISYLVGIERDVFILRIYLGYKFRDIDDTLDLSKNQSYYIFKKAIEKVKEYI